MVALCCLLIKVTCMIESAQWKVKKMCMISTDSFNIGNCLWLFFNFYILFKILYIWTIYRVCNLIDTIYNLFKVI